jgi:hypothetical protein
MEKKGLSKAKAKAKAKLVAICNLKSVAALNQFLKRAKRDA